MKLFEEMHPHSAAKMNGQADRSMYDRKNARPDTQIAAQIVADGIRPPSQNIPWTEP
jgi:hypothetical protein